MFAGMAASLWVEALLELQARLRSIIKAHFDLRQLWKFHLSTCPGHWHRPGPKREFKIIQKNTKFNPNLFSRVED